MGLEPNTYKLMISQIHIGNGSFSTGYISSCRICINSSSKLLVPSKPSQKFTTRITTMASMRTSKATMDLMLVSDLDSTMVDHEDPTHKALLNFNSLWACDYSHNSYLVYSSGRSPEKYRELRRQAPLLTPSMTILSIGTEIFHGKSMEIDQEWLRVLDQGWDRNAILQETKAFPELQLQDDVDQRPHKISFFLRKEKATEVQELLRSRLEHLRVWKCSSLLNLETLIKLAPFGRREFLFFQIEVKFIYSNGTAFDILPKMGGKGEALTYLIKKMRREGWQSQTTLVCGDSGNDIDLFLVDGVKGVIVSNAQEELLRWCESNNFANTIHRASERCAAGITEAIKHFQLGKFISPRQKLEIADFHAEENVGEQIGFAKREVLEFNIFLEMWLSGIILNEPKTYQRVLDVIADNATMVSHWGTESNLRETMESMRNRHGIMKGKCFLTWIDNIEEMKIAESIYMVTWESWEKVDGGDAKGYYNTAILVSKEKAPNGVEWLRVHATSRHLK